MSITITLEATRLKCQSCEHLMEDGVEFDPAYECECGEIFTRNDSDNGKNQCPNCNRFAAKSDDYHECPECGDAAEFEEVPVITCVCHDEEHEVYA